jgi:murein DD-endopeptidase MepM/ murein hydrolase activator NlpD
VVEWAAMKGPNGNLTILRHDNGWQTYYLHQSMFMPGIAPGAHVGQGQKIGEIGTTGRSTGPHLHYEVHIDGHPVDSMTIHTESGQTLSGPALIAFAKERDRIDVSRAGQAQ